MNHTTDYISEEKRKELEIELEDLKGPRRKEILASLKYAKSLGDLSENAEYHQAREDQGKLEGRITKIEEILRSSLTVKRSRGGTVDIGSTVFVKREGGGGESEKSYIIVGTEEADTAKNKISNKSPIGVALAGKKEGDRVSFKTPKGEVNYKILSVS